MITLNAYSPTDASKTVLEGSIDITTKVVKCDVQHRR